MKCKTHPDAPHGFDRNGSHSEDRYVCMCEHWEPPQPRALVLAEDLKLNHTYCPEEVLLEASEELRRLYSVNERLLRERHFLVESSQKDAATLTEKDALLRQALEALEAAEFHAKCRIPDASIEVAVQPAIVAIKERLK
jgi:hypothetical protein